jgi:UDP-N-acetylglucosamine 2-epimerase
VTQPNADEGGSEIRAFWTAWAKGRPNVVLRDALGDAMYWGLMREADLMVGNSSSGIIEAPAAGLDVVNVGDRQRGRLRPSRIVDVPPESGAIRDAMGQVLQSPRRADRAIASGPYISGPAAPRVVAALAEWLPRRTMRKAFQSIGR